LTGIVRAIQGKKRDFNGHCDKGVTWLCKKKTTRAKPAKNL
jgi:hypothetical protein